MRQLLLTVSAVLLIAVQASASGLVVYAAEYGIGKFHRMDNKAHKYDGNNAWAKFILPENAAVTLNQSTVIANNDGSVTIFFPTLEDLLVTAEKVAAQRGVKI